jgi:hypothetical protein
MGCSLMHAASGAGAAQLAHALTFQAVDDDVKRIVCIPLAEILQGRTNSSDSTPEGQHMQHGLQVHKMQAR